MLVALHVQGFAVIEAAELKLEPGLNVLSGETGAGKSIVAGALQLALGGRARSDVVRPGAKQAEVHALFDISTDVELMDQLQQSGIQCDGELAVRRIISANGRSRAYLNGRPCAANELQAMAPRLADVTSQHASVALTDPAQQLRYLDQYAVTAEQRDRVAAAVLRVQQLDKQLLQLRTQERERSEREAFLRFQLETITNVAPEPDEQQQLQQERGRLRNANELSRLTSHVSEALSGDNSGDDVGGKDESACDIVGRAATNMQHAAELDSSLRDLALEMEACFSQLHEAAQHVTDYARRVEANPARLEEVSERLFQLESLLRKHGPTVADVLSTRDRIDEELSALDQLSTTLPALASARVEALEQALTVARKLSRSRKSAAKKLARTAQTFLRELGMPTAVVEVVVAARKSGTIDCTSSASSAAKPKRTGHRAKFLSSDGADVVELRIATNQGMDPRPLSRIASGGELSRVLLAMKRALGVAASKSSDGMKPGNGARPSSNAKSGSHARRVGVNSSGVTSIGGAMRPMQCGIQVFDEVDAGIGGATADKVGRAVAAIAPHRQVLCITHLAAIAAYADAHFVVEKHEHSGTTETTIQKVDGKARVAELARMLTGRQTAKTSLRAARELLAAAVAISAAAA